MDITAWNDNTKVSSDTSTTFFSMPVITFAIFVLLSPAPPVLIQLMT